MSKSILRVYLLLVYLLFFIVEGISPAVVNTTTTSLPVYNIGIIFPNTKNVIDYDPNLADMIATSELAIQLAADDINNSKLLPDVQLNFTRYYSDETNPGITAWAAVNMVENGVHAVIGDMVSSMTEASAAITGIWQIPQCSCASAAYTLSNKKTYPYFFRTVGNVVLYGESLVDWVSSMGWTMFALIYTNDAVGQQVLHTILDQANKRHVTAMTNIPLYSLMDEQIEEALLTLESSGSRVVILADSDTSDQLAILKKAMSLGLLSKGWVWILTNDISPVLHEIIDSENEMSLYDGLMFISGLWDLSGEPAYDSFNRIWKSQRVPEYFSSPSEWNTTSLSYNAPQAYSCTQLLARGLNEALNTYPGGRSAGLADLKKGAFNSTVMRPEFYNLNYTGPAGYMGFSETGDLQSGYFQIFYIKNGVGIPYASIKLNELSFMPNTTIQYLGQTTEKPMDMVTKLTLNPTLKQASGIVIIVVCVLGLLLSNIMVCLIFWFRDLKPILISSPLFCYIQLAGISMAYISMTLYVDKPNPAKCIARQILLYGGFSLVIGSIIAKNYRVYRVFQNVFAVRTSKLKSVYLARMVAAFTVVGLVPLIIWNAIYPIKVTDTMITSNTYCWLCSYPTATSGNWDTINAVDIIVIIWGAIMIILSAFLAFKTRNVNRKWSETTQIAYVSYLTGLTALVASSSFFIPMDNFQVAIFLKIACILFGATFTLFVLFAPKFAYIVRHIIKHNKKFSLYRMNSESQSHLNKPNVESFNDNMVDLVAKNLFDFSMQAHEGILPVKKLAKFDFLSIWELKHIILVPVKRYFILSKTKSGDESTLHNYVHIEVVSTESKQHCFFCVRTDKGLIFKFQVSDKESLDRWLGWFHGRETVAVRKSPPVNDEKKVKTVTIVDSVSDDYEETSNSAFSGEPQKLQSATFGFNESSSLAHASSSYYYNNSSYFYPQNHISYTENIEDVNYPTSSIRYSDTHQLTPVPTNNLDEPPLTSLNSFGVHKGNDIWQRYP